MHQTKPMDVTVLLYIFIYFKKKAEKEAQKARYLCPPLIFKDFFFQEVQDKHIPAAESLLINNAPGRARLTPNSQSQANLFAF